MSYELTVDNKKIYDFYKQHTNLDFEEMNILFVDILGKIIESSNPSLNTSVASQIVDSIKSLQTQVSSSFMSRTRGRLSSQVSAC